MKTARKEDSIHPEYKLIMEQIPDEELFERPSFGSMGKWEALRIVCLSCLLAIASGTAGSVITVQVLKKPAQAPIAPRIADVAPEIDRRLHLISEILQATVPVVTRLERERLTESGATGSREMRASSADGGIATVTVERANLRSGPSMDAAQTLNVPRGARLMVVGALGDWVQVLSPSGDVAWVSKDVVRIAPASEVVIR